MRVSIIFFCFLFISTTEIAQSEKLYEEVTALFNEEKFDECLALEPSLVSWATSRKDTLAANVFGYLANAHLTQEAFDKAALFFDRERQVRVNLLPENQLDYSNVLYNLAFAYLQANELEKAKASGKLLIDFDKTTLKSESFVELDKVVDFLQKNPTVEIEIAGHTDFKGTDDYNFNLSQGRCQSVVDYIVSQGVDSYRLTPHGYGESKPVDTNDTDAGRANNRRVEFTVMKK